MLSTLMKGWNSTPIITTIDSAAIPVSKLYFPTVTVCPHDIPVDNWAYVEKIAAMYKFHSVENEKMYPKYEETTLLKKDFQPFLTMIIEKFNEVLSLT